MFNYQLLINKDIASVGADCETDLKVSYYIVLGMLNAISDFADDHFNTLDVYRKIMEW